MPNHFEKPFFATPAIAVPEDGDSESGQEGADIAEYLLGQAIRGLCSGPMASSFKTPEAPGAFAARVVDGAHDHWYGADT